MTGIAWALVRLISFDLPAEELPGIGESLVIVAAFLALLVMLALAIGGSPQ